MFVLSLFGCKENNNQDIFLPFAGINSGLTQKQVSKSIVKQLSKSSSSILSKLDQVETQVSNWELTRLAVGLFFVFESEITDIYKIEIEPSVELRFQQL